MLVIGDDMVAVRLLYDDGYGNSGIAAPFFINEVYDPSVCRDAIVVSAPKALRSAAVNTSNKDLVPDGALVNIRPSGKHGEWSYTHAIQNDGLLEAGDKIRITATRQEDCFGNGDVSVIAWDSILWVEKHGSMLPLMNGVMVKRMEREGHILMDSGNNYEPCIGIVACVGIPRSGIQTSLKAGDAVMFKSRKGAVSIHQWEGNTVEYVPFLLITGILG